MKIIKGLNNLKERFRKPVVTMGVFDGVHVGHQAILRRVVSRAKKRGGTGICLTFDPHPNKILGAGSGAPLLLSIRHRLKLIEESGIDVCVVIRFSRQLARCGAEYFVKNILIKKLGMVEFIVGHSHTFGYRKEGRSDFLKGLASRYKFAFTVVPKVKAGKCPVSSSIIRSLIRAGRLNQAARLLGRRVSLLGTVVKGRARGRLLGYPTANLNPHHEVIPPEGVYAVSGTYRKRFFGGMLYIGRRPTFGETEPVIEVHIFDLLCGISKFHTIRGCMKGTGSLQYFGEHKRGTSPPFDPPKFCGGRAERAINLKGDLYGKDLEVHFLKKLRPERFFSSEKKLIAQLRRDEVIARNILRKMNVCRQNVEAACT